jgi:hypothetical protein
VVISKYLADAEEEKAALKQWEAANKGKAPEEQEPAPMSVMRHYLPERYADAKTSGLSAEVKKGKNVIDFAMKVE